MRRRLALAAAVAAGLMTPGGPVTAAPAHPLVRIAELSIDPARLDAYQALLTEEIETSIRLEPGVLQLNAVALKDRPEEIRLLEVYADQTAYEAHLNSPHFRNYKVATADMVRSLRLIETTPIALGRR